MGRRATGQAVFRTDEHGVPRWHARISLPDGTRPYEPLEGAAWTTEDTPENRALARQAAAELSATLRGSRAVPAGTAFTFGEWLKRFHAHKAARGRSSVADMKGRAEHWILPHLAHRPIAQITREEIETIVSKLDDAIGAWNKANGKRGKGRLSPSSAANIWGDLSHAFDEACNAKDKTLRVLTVNPAEHVRGPDTGADREGPVLYSDEVVALLTGKAMEEGAPDVPLYRRHVYALAIYTCARRSELAALTAADVDLAHQTITIARQVERTKEKGATVAGTKATKTRRARVFDIEAAMLPLVTLLTKRPEGNAGRLVRVPPIEDCAELLRKDLWTVGVRAARLHTADAARTMMTFHCLRDTGLTHMAVRGDSPAVVQWRAGHTDYKMTQGYVTRGGVEARRIGAPLPPLPASILALADKGREKARKGSASRKFPFSLGNIATPTGIEPVLPT
jgi:integrase